MRRRKRRLLLLLVLAVVAALLLLLRLRAAPLMEQLVVTQAENTMSTLVNEIVNDQIAKGTIDYDRIIYFEKDVDGRITALKTNMSEVNRLKTEIELDIPIGNFIFPELFSGTGFAVPVRILSVSTSDANFENHFSEAGINQTLHQIRMNILVNLSVLTPTGTVQTSVSTDVVVAETVIVGTVPDRYVSIGLPES